MNIRDLHPHGASIYAIIAGCPLLIFMLVGAILSREPVLPEREWSDGTFWP